jgi:hypothetical protein
LLDARARGELGGSFAEHAEHAVSDTKPAHEPEPELTGVSAALER